MVRERFGRVRMQIIILVPILHYARSSASSSRRGLELDTSTRT